MASNIVNESALTVLVHLTNLPRLKEALQGFVASFYEHVFKDRDKNLLQRAPERKGTGDSETSLEGRGPTEVCTDATVDLTSAERREARKQKAEEDNKRKAEEKERKDAEKGVN